MSWDIYRIGRQDVDSRNVAWVSIETFVGRFADRRAAVEYARRLGVESDTPMVVRETLGDVVIGEDGFRAAGVPKPKAQPPVTFHGVALKTIPAGAAVTIEVDPMTGATTVRPATL